MGVGVSGGKYADQTCQGQKHADDETTLGQARFQDLRDGQNQ
jgi:hypothetical protein